MATKESQYYHNIGSLPLIVGRHTLAVDEYRKVMRDADLETDHVIDAIEKGWLEVVPEKQAKSKAAKKTKEVETEETLPMAEEGFATLDEAKEAAKEESAPEAEPEAETKEEKPTSRRQSKAKSN